MDELVKKLQETAGLSSEQALSAAKCVKTYLKDKMPSLMADQLDSVFDGKKVEMGDILREKAEGAVGEAKEALGAVATMLDNFAGKATRETESVVDKVTSFLRDQFDGDDDKTKKS